MTDTITGPAWIAAFLATLASGKRVDKAVEAAGVTSGAVYFQRRRNQRFAEAWQAALASVPTPDAPIPDAPVPTASAEAPVPMPARNAGWKVLFLETLAETSNVTASASRANVPVETVYKTRRKEPAFAARWLAALHEGYDNLEMELLCYLRDPDSRPKMDVAGATRLLAAHREMVERRRALIEEEDEQSVRESIDAFLENMRQRRLANEAILLEAGDADVAG